MASKLKIPRLGMSMAEGTIIAWLVNDGENISVGQPLYLLETDKTQNEVASPVAGRITLLASLDQPYEVGTVIATVE
jgi:pyruvate/2-oxoglutarate dehydrogenase complex dihydrolipoamide acyltransferase (E2) component